MENAGIDPATSHMLSERSTIWANSPLIDDYERGGDVLLNIWKGIAFLSFYNGRGWKKIANSRPVSSAG